MKRVIQYLFVSLMFVVPVTGFLSSDPSYVIKSENRTLAKFPKYGSNEYFSDLVKWYTDRLFGKISISEKYFSLFNSVFADYSFSPNRQSVKGESNWFFLGNYAYYQHSREVTIPLSKTNRKIAFLKELRNSSNAPFYLVVGPDKHGVYSEFLRPYIYEPGKYRSFDNYKHYLTDNGIDYIDNLDSILAEKSNLKNNQTLYYTNDTHWNSYGAYVAFNNVMRHIVDNYDPIKYSFIFSSNLTGDLTRNIVAPKHRFLDDVKVKSIQKNIFDYISLLEINEFDKNVLCLLYNGHYYENFSYGYKVYFETYYDDIIEHLHDKLDLTLRELNATNDREANEELKYLVYDLEKEWIYEIVNQYDKADVMETIKNKCKDIYLSSKIVSFIQSKEEQ